jgi:hypothetical protein
VTEPRQLRLSRPERRLDVDGLSPRQRATWLLLRDAGRAGASLADLQAALAADGYSNPSAALSRLVARGLARRLRRGVYAPTRIGERAP